MPEHNFYVGYEPHAAPVFNRARFLFAACVLIVAAAVAVAVATTQQGQPEGVFEFGNIETFNGMVRTTPLPHLETNASVRLGEAAETRHLLLVGFGKRGPSDEILAADGYPVRFRGTLIYQGALGMVEITEPASFERLDGESGLALEVSIPESVTLLGELVDTKCYLGVMRPGEGKVHRACAVQCLRGGVPPGILVRSEDGSGRVYPLAGRVGAPLDLDPQWAARSIRVEGRLVHRGTMPVVHVDTLELL